MRETTDCLNNNSIDTELSEIFDAVDIPVIVFDHEGVIVYCNSSFFNDFTFFSGDNSLTGTNFFDIFFVESSEKDKTVSFAETISLAPKTVFKTQILWNKHFFDISIKLFRYNGSRFYSSLFKKNGRKINLVSDIVDNYDKRKSIAKGNKYTDEDYSDLFNRIPIGLYRSTPEGELIIYNQVFRQIVGFDEKLNSKINLDWFGKKIEYQREKFKNEIEKYGYVNDYETTYVDSKLNIRYLKESAKLVTDSNGKKYYEGIVIDITESKNAQLNLAESEEKYRSLFYKSEDAILLLDYNKWADCNESALKLLGYADKNDIIGKRPDEISPEMQEGGYLSHDKAIEMINIGYQNGKHRFEWVHTKSNGEDFFVDVMLTVIPYKGKKLLYTILRDITEQKKAQENLMLSEEKFRLLFEESRDGLVLIDEYGKVCEFNKTMEIITGINRNEVIDLNAWDFQHRLMNPDRQSKISVSQIKNTVLNVLKGNEDIFFEKGCYTLIKNDGSSFYAEIKNFFIKTKTGKMLCVVISDITEEKQKNEEIRSTKDLYETIIRTAPASIGILTLDGMLVYASERMQRIFEIDEELESRSFNVKQLIMPNSIEKAVNAYKDLLNKGIVNSLELELVSSRGNTFLGEVNASVMYGAGGAPEAILIVSTDITQRKEAEKSMKLSMSAMLDAGKKRMEALQLMDNSARLASIGVIAGGVIHEIAQPLNAIKIGSDGILSWDSASGNVLPDVMIKLMQGISTASQRIEEILNHMRSYWVESNNDSFSFVDLNDSVYKSLNMAMQRIKSHEIAFELNLEKKELFVYANSVQLELIVNNLIVNAVNSLDGKHTRDKKIRLATSEKNNRVYLEVYDNGIGISDIDPDKLFDPFNFHRNSVDGQNMGLAIVRMFVDKFSANISFSQNEEGGTTFLIDFDKNNRREAYA